MIDLRGGLGGDQPGRDHLPENLRHIGLTCRELGELIRRAGIAAGFIVESEVVVVRGMRPRIDWVWFVCGDSHEPVLAVEVEGRDVAPKSLDADFRKLSKFRAPRKAIALFQIDHDRSPKAEKKHPKCRVKAALDEFKKGQECRLDTEIVMDVELMAPRGIEQLQRQAIAARQALKTGRSI